MIGFIKKRLDALLGQGDYSTAVPVMDGPLQPNELIDAAELLFEAGEIDNLTAARGAIYFSSGNKVCRYTSEKGVEQVVECVATITSLAVSDTGILAIGLDKTGVRLVGGEFDGKLLQSIASKPLNCPTALCFVDDSELLVAQGSNNFCASEWKYDLMGGGSTGSIARINLNTLSSEILASGLKFPYGLCLQNSKTLVFSEAWAHRLVALNLIDRSKKALLSNLPGYPSRITKRENGNYILSVFAPRNQMVEFVLREKSYRQAMMMQVEESYWIAPALRSGESYKEPLQGGAVKQMGILKPWAPAFSYGLVIELDSELNPLDSWHSRANGQRHGITSACEWQGSIAAGSKGAQASYLLLPSANLTQGQI